MKPLGARILIQVSPPANTSVGGIYLPDNTKERPVTGQVISIGPCVRVVREDDTVLMPKYGGTDLAIKGLPFRLLEEKDIIGVVTE